MMRQLTLERRLFVVLAAMLIAFGGASWLESRMYSHMLIQLPLLVLAGWLVNGFVPLEAPVAKIDQYGILGMTMLLLVSAYWMVPRALELSLTSAWFEDGKIASLFSLGLILPGSLKRCPWVAQLFFLGNFGAMMAIAGIQYQDLPQRLCNAYLLDDQNLTGIGLTATAILISLTWSARILQALNARTSN